MDSIDSTQEIWKVIKGYNNYSVSSMGRFRNDVTGHISQATPKKGEYLRVIVRNKYLTKGIHIHILVAMTFIENPENKPQVDHINRNIHQNHVDNLRWATSKEQCNNKVYNGFISQKHRRAVWMCDKKTGKKLKLFENTDIATKEVCYTEKGRSQYIVNSICSSKPIFGYKWMYAEEEAIPSEIWKPLSPSAIGEDDDIPNGFHVSDHGRMRNPSGVIRVPYEIHHGYTGFTIHDKPYRSHRIVALTFLENPENKPIVNHIDGDKKNCNLSNLEWVTYKENAEHAVKTGLVKSTPINQYGLDGSFIKTHINVPAAQRDLGKFKGNILNALETGFTTAGFQWRIYDGDETPITPVEDGRKRNCICQFTKDGVFVRRFLNASEACKEFGVSPSTILNYVKKSKPLNGMYFRREKGNVPKKRPDIIPVSQCDENGDLIENFYTIVDATRKTGHNRFVIQKSYSTGIPHRGIQWVKSGHASLKRKRED